MKKNINKLKKTILSQNKTVCFHIVKYYKTKELTDRDMELMQKKMRNKFDPKTGASTARLQMICLQSGMKERLKYPYDQTV